MPEPDPALAIPSGPYISIDVAFCVIPEPYGGSCELAYVRQIRYKRFLTHRLT